ncbi:MAG: bifunctional DNA-formamidopyrimidine glycosylase/DNA-(apurinic or apyrimidinic site) lyase [Planctomycetota bacterium]
MPELPEVECVRRGLAKQLIGRRIEAVKVRRADVVRGIRDRSALLGEHTIERIDRHGKQLALVAERAHHGGPRPCVVIHLGMSGQLRLSSTNRRLPTTPIRRPIPETSSPDPKISPAPAHCHVIWQFAGNTELRFIDPRRFGGVWTFTDTRERDQQRWSALGPDGLSVTPGQLRRALLATRRPIKAALLDQQVVAGLGNIYVDELLFRCGLHPLTPANQIGPDQSARLCRAMRTLLTRAIEQGGSTLRDYVDASGQSGGYQDKHQVYGRSGQRCARRPCRAMLKTGRVAGRTTVWCPRCQPREEFPTSRE